MATTVRTRPSAGLGQARLQTVKGSRVRIRPREFRQADFGILVATIVSSLAVVWILFEQLTLLSGPFGFIICWLASFLVLYWAVNLQLYGRQVAADRFVAALVASGALCMMTPLVLLTWFLIDEGYRYFSLHLFVATQAGALETASAHGPKAGLAHAIVGTFEQVGLATAMGVPAAVLTAIFLNEVGGRLTRWVRIVVTAMSGTPAIVAGVFIYSVWIVSFHNGYSGFAGSMAIAVILLPTVTRGTEEVLKLVSGDLREAAAALGAPEWRIVWSVVLPTAFSGLLTAVLLGIAVGIGETAPLLMTVFGNKTMNADPFSGPQASLPLLIWQNAKSSQPSDVHLAYAAALVLFLLVFMVFMLARFLGNPWLLRTIRARQDRRAARTGP